MTEYVKVTREQAEAIEKWENGTQLLKAAVVGLLNHGADEPIAEMPTETLAKAIYIGYEVEPDFKVGDWVVHEYDKKPREIIRESNYKNGDCGEYVVDNGNGVLPKFLRHATPSEIAEEKERRWWKKHGRDVWELKKGDLLKNTHNYLTYEVVDVNEKGGIAFVSDIGFRDKNSIVVTYKVACFTKDRLDVKTND